LLVNQLSLLKVVCGLKLIPWIPVFWVLAILVVQSSCFAIRVALHIFHSHYLPMSHYHDCIIGTGEIKLLRVNWFCVGASWGGGAPGTLSMSRSLFDRLSMAIQVHLL
jgi:hypothetical protein